MIACHAQPYLTYYNYLQKCDRPVGRSDAGLPKNNPFMILLNKNNCVAASLLNLGLMAIERFGHGWHLACLSASFGYIDRADENEPGQSDSGGASIQPRLWSALPKTKKTMPWGKSCDHHQRGAGLIAPGRKFFLAHIKWPLRFQTGDI